MNKFLTSKSLQFSIAIIVAIFTTGFLRLQLFTALPGTDGGLYTFVAQYIHHTLGNGEDLKFMTLNFYQMLTYWVYGLEVNQIILLRIVDGLIAIVASIFLFKVILKESGSKLFTVILMFPLLILMNDIEVIAYGYRNSIWAAYIPLFAALLIWQKISDTDKFSFYIIGALISLGVLLREPFLPFFLLLGVAITVAYGWRILLKYLIGATILGSSVLAFALMLRGWDLIDLINSYLNLASGLNEQRGGVTGSSDFILKMFISSGAKFLQKNWFIVCTALASVIYLIQLYSVNKKLVSMNRVYFWILISLIPIIEPMVKLGFEYHFAQSLPGLAGLSAMGWRYLNSNQSKKVVMSSVLILSLASLIVVGKMVKRSIINSDYIYTPSIALKLISMPDMFRGAQTIERSQYLIIARKIYELTKEDSTLAVFANMAILYPLTELLPPTYELSSLNAFYTNQNLDNKKLIKAIKKNRPTIIAIPNDIDLLAAKNLTDIIKKTNLYKKVMVVPKNPAINYGWKSIKIYRLKDFK